MEKMKKSQGRKQRTFRGLSLVALLLCGLLIGVQLIAQISDYKLFINNIFGAQSAGISGSIDAYAFTSDYQNTVEMYTARVNLVEQLGEEGCVLLKNDAVGDQKSLPLRQNGDEAAKSVTVLGTSAYTYKKDGSLRGNSTLGDASRTLYGGIVGSTVTPKSVTVLNEQGNQIKINSPVDLKTALAAENVQINPTLEDVYNALPYVNTVSGSEANGSSGGPFSIGEPHISLAQCGSYQNYSDACFVMLSRSSGEGREYFPGQLNGVADKTDGSKSALSLSNDERNLIEVANQISNNVIVLLSSSVAMEIDELKTNDKVDSILWIGQPGGYGMSGIARVISGKASASGRLPDTYAVDASASPAAQNFGVTAQDGSGEFRWSNLSTYNNADNSHYVVLAEDMYVGYYYYETRYADCVRGEGNAKDPVGLGYAAREKNASEWKYEDEVAYTFGYGLSYADFTQEIVPDSLKVDLTEKTVSLDVKVTNNSNFTAKEVIELYVQTPYTEYDKKNAIEKPAIQLLNFDKVELEGGASTTVTITSDIKYFASYDEKVSHDGVTGGWILEKGDYYFAIGNGAHEALNNALHLEGYSQEELYLEEGSSLNVNGAILWKPENDGVSFDGNGVNSSLFATSESGYPVQNQLQDADYNYFAGENAANSVTYLSRSDWNATFPKAYISLDLYEGMYKYLNEGQVYDFNSKNDQVTIDVEFGIDHGEEEDEEGNPLENMTLAEMKLAAFDDERWDYLLSQISFDEAWKLSPYGGTSCEPFASVAVPEAWQIDGPNGNVTRGVGDKAAKNGPLAVNVNDPNYGYYSNDMTAEPLTAATWNKALLEAQGEIFGEDMMWGRNVMAWAPGMNLHRTPFNSRNHEYYSEDPMLTNYLGTACVRGGLKKGAILAAKHFAFNTQESFREGLVQFMEEQSARELELRAYQGLFEDAKYINSLGHEVNALGMMTSFSRIGVCGVNAHTGLMKHIVRGEFGFKGLSSTDMVVGGRFFCPEDSVVNNVTFMATSNAENLLQMNWKEYSNKGLVKSDPYMMQSLYENMHYYMYAIANSSLLNGYTADSVVEVGGLEPWEVTFQVFVIITAVAAFALAGLSVAFGVVKRKKAVAEGEAPEDGAPADEIEINGKEEVE